MDQQNRVVVLIDMDCFYCQVEEKLNPELKDKPIAVVQYNPWQGGGIIAVNYIARAKGVKRGMRGKEAKEKCPEIELPSVPCLRGKADISRYREAGKEVARVLQKFSPLLERASIDEAYLDITAPVEQRLNTLNLNTVNTIMMPNTHALGYNTVEELLADTKSHYSENIDFDYEHAKRLLIGAVIVSEIRAAVYDETGYRCSAGIAHNKILAKLVCGFNKPNKQTILPKHSVNLLYSTLSLKKIKHLGGKFGDTVCDILRISRMGELQKYSEKELQSRLDDKNGTWLYNIARGIDLEPVQVRLNPKSIGCCKQFRGKAALLHLENLRKWLKDLGDEIEDRLEQDALENNRTPKQMVVSFSTQIPGGKDISSSRSYNFTPDDELCAELFSGKALELLMESSEGVKVKEDEDNRKLKAPITFLGISVGKFEDISETKKTKKILDYFTAGSAKEVVDKPKNTKHEVKAKVQSKPNGKDYIMQKFLQVSNKTQSVEIPADHMKSAELQKAPITESETVRTNENAHQGVVESTLDEQESFFAKILNQNANDPQPTNSNLEEKMRAVTPLCDVVKCEDDTNDSNYSGSTIINEIDKSMALFEDDPEDVARVSSIRQLLNSSKVITEEEHTVITEPEINLNQVNDTNSQIESFQTYDCIECGKSIPIEAIETHSDYHLALRLRDEERQQVRNEKAKLDKTTVKRKSEDFKKRKQFEDSSNKNKSISSITSFLVKVDSNIPTETCSDCGKRIPVEKFAEHLDFHEAQKLNRQLNNKINPQLSGGSVKRKRISTSPTKKNIKPCRSNSALFK